MCLLNGDFKFTNESTVGSKVSTQEEFKIINESITGLFSNEVTIV